MEVKLFEIRDAMTFVSVMATRLGGRTPKETWLLARGGYGKTIETQRTFVILTALNPGPQSQHDQYKWEGGRTLRLAHEYIIHNWEKLTSGDVVDVEYNEEETDTPKTSEFNE